MRSLSAKKMGLLPRFCSRQVKSNLCVLYFAGRGARFRRDALRHGVRQLKQRKIDARQRLCFDGLVMQQCFSEDMSGVVKTVKDHAVN